MRKVRWLLFLVVALMCGISYGSDNRFIRLEAPAVIKNLDSAPSDLTERVALLKKAFENAGCEAKQITEQAVPGQAAPNVLCTLPGKEEGTIVIAARLDYKSKGDELTVDSATLNLLPLLAQSLYPTERKYTMVFIAFSGSDKRQGSSYYLSQLTGPQKKAIRGMVFLDHLGRSGTRFMFPSQSNDSDISHVGRNSHGLVSAEHGSSSSDDRGLGGRRSDHDDTALRKQFALASKAVQLGDPDELSEFFFTDALSFDKQNVMALSLTSPAYTIIVRDFGKREVKMPRTSVDQKIYYETYNLLCVYLLYLDNTLVAKK